MRHSWQFLRRYFKNPRVVGAVAPSSRQLAAAICEPYRQSRRPVSVLEVGAGTGSFTRYLGVIMGTADRIDVCEVVPDFAAILERDVLGRPPFAAAFQEGRVRMLNQPVQEIPDGHQYDFIISGLPFTSFELEDVRAVFDVIRRCLKPGGVFSYFEYVGLRRTRTMLSFGRTRDRRRAVSGYLTDHIRSYQFNRDTVLKNLPPAYVRHLRFDARRSPALAESPR